MTQAEGGAGYTALRNPNENNIGFYRSNDEVIKLTEVEKSGFDIYNYKL